MEEDIRQAVRYMVWVVAAGVWLAVVIGLAVAQ